MKYEKKTLKNGVRVIIAPMTDTETATVLVMTATGSRYESRKENGIAHFLEHMFFKGTEKRPDKMDIAHELDAIGAEYNAFTGKEYTGYYAKVVSQHLPTAVDVVSDIFLHSTLDQKEIDMERGAILQEINMYEDMPMRRVGEIFEQQLYGDTPLGWDIAGPKENIKRFRRADFVRYMKRGYVSENVIVGVAGKVDPKKVYQELEKHFLFLQEGKKPIFKKVSERQKASSALVQYKKTDQTHFIVGVRTFDRYHKDRYILSVLATVLGGGMSSRLFMEVREKRGLAYSVHTGSEAYHDAGYVATQCGVEHNNLEKALEVVLEEYKKITQEKVPDKELSKAKEYLKGKMAMGLEGSDSVVEFLVSQEATRDEIILPEERARRIDAVSVEDVLRVAQDIFVSKNLNLTVIGPHRETKRKKLEKMLSVA